MSYIINFIDSARFMASLSLAEVIHKTAESLVNMLAKSLIKMLVETLVKMLT